MKKIKNYRWVVTVAMILLLYACNAPLVSDDDILKSTEAALKEAFPEVHATVEEGVVTLSGSVANEASITKVAATVQAINGVTEVINEVLARTIVSPNDALSNAVKEAIKEYPTILAIISDSVVILSGNLKTSDRALLLQKVQAVKPRKLVTKNIVWE